MVNFRTFEIGIRYLGRVRLLSLLFLKLAGIVLSLINPSPCYAKRLKITVFHFVFSGSLLCMGALFGSLSAVYLMDAVGRKASLLAFSVMSLFIGWTLLMAASQHWQLYTGRFLLGKVTKF